MGNIGRKLDQFNARIETWAGRLMEPIFSLLMVLLVVAIFVAAAMSLLRLAGLVAKEPTPRDTTATSAIATAPSQPIGKPTLEAVQAEIQELKSFLTVDPSRAISVQRMEARADYIEKRLDALQSQMNWGLAINITLALGVLGAVGLSLKSSRGTRSEHREGEA